MIYPISFLWRQMNGPQITAIAQAIWQYFRDSFDNTLNYFNTLSISKANTDHLTLIGILQGLARPLIPIPDEQYFWFTDVYDFEPGDMYDGTYPEGHTHPTSNYPSHHGFGSNPPRNDPNGVGGALQELTMPGQYSYLSNTLFRALVKANSASEGYLGSIVALDDMIYALWRTEHETTAPGYRFSFTENRSNPNNAAGDVVLNLGVTGDWTNGYEVQAEVKLLGNTVYYPAPKLIPILAEGDSKIDPEGLVRILIVGEEQVQPDGTSSYVPGLNDMWADPPQTPSSYIDDGVSPPEAWKLEPITTGMIQTMFSADGTSWVDDPDPSDEFEALLDTDLEKMWL